MKSTVKITTRRVMILSACLVAAAASLPASQTLAAAASKASARDAAVKSAVNRRKSRRPIPPGFRRTRNGSADSFMWPA
jgi:hypothetical protein